MSYEVFGEPDDPPRCCCGHASDEHGGDDEFPGSSACGVTGCDCIAYEANWDHGAEDDYE